MPDAAVIIPHYNDVTRLLRCLGVLMPQIGPHTGPQVEVVVIDNGSTQSLAPVRAAYPGLRIVEEARKGAACARNRGVDDTTAPLLFFLDCDCVPDPDWLAAALRLTRRPGAQQPADIIGGAVTVFAETAPPRTGAQAFEAVFAFDNRAYVARKGFSVTANLLTRRDVFAAVGPFTPGLSEDLEWCHRARALGFKLAYAPDLQVAHPSRGDWTALRKKWWRLTQESYGVHQGARGTGLRGRLSWAATALLMPFSVPVHALRILRHPGLTWAERAAALQTLARLRLARAIWMLRQAANSYGATKGSNP